MAQRPSPEAKVRISVRAKPRASRSRIVRVDGLSVEAALAAPPVDGAANAALLELLAEVLELRKSALSLVVGQTSKHKLVEVDGLGAAEVGRRLEKAAGDVSLRLGKATGDGTKATAKPK